MNVFDYLLWRGDLSFQESPLNEIDILIFSWLSYYQLEKLFKRKEQFHNLSFREIAKRHEEKFGYFKERDINLTIIPGESAEYLFYKVSGANRFENVKLLDFKEIFSKKDTTQFAAMTFKIDEKTSVISFRGTDTSIIGWKEDCQLSYKEQIGGQTQALNYYNQTDLLENVILCGHSKGGNLALFVLYNLPETELSKIKSVYNFDAPGFIKDYQSNERYKECEPKVFSYIPQSSIVGMLLEHEEKYTIVDSKMISAFQHNAMMWKILGTHFVTVDNQNVSSEFFDKTFALWLKKLPLEERKEFIETIFSIFNDLHIRNITDIGEDFLINIKNIIKNIKTLNKEQIKMILHVFVGFSIASGRTMLEMNDLDEESNGKKRKVFSIAKKIASHLLTKHDKPLLSRR